MKKWHVGCLLNCKDKKKHEREEVMNQQKKILETYIEEFNRPTLREIAEQTGIQITRIFRIMNGSSMKYSEYLIFRELIEKKKGLNSELIQIVEDATLSLSADAIEKIHNMLERKIRLIRLMELAPKQRTDALCVS